MEFGNLELTIDSAKCPRCLFYGIECGNPIPGEENVDTGIELDDSSQAEEQVK